MNSVQILCEGPMCNSGQSANDRESSILLGLPARTEVERHEAAKFARGETSRALRLTSHSRVGVGRGGTLLFACDTCGHERIYGNTFWSAA